MNEKPIGVFDSGLGGLTVVRELLRVLPGEDIVYFGDTGRIPYGTRSNETIQKYTRQDVSFLLRQDVKMVIAACGTVSSVAQNVTDTLPVPFTGVTVPAAKAAAVASKNGVIGALGTNATIGSGAYERIIKSVRPTARVVSVAAPMLVQLVENGWTDPGDRVVELTVRRYLKPLLDAGVDTVILGCTHFPLLMPVMREIMGDGVCLIDTGREAAHEARRILRANRLLSDSGAPGKCRYFVSDKVQNFSIVAGTLLGRNIEDSVELMDVSLRGE